MTSRPTELELAEPHMRQWLSTIGLDAVYVRAEGNTLYTRDGDDEVAVLDYVGGYGSLMFGHNHPELVAYAKSLLDDQIPIHAQFSRHPYANDVAGLLSEIIMREFGTDEPYSAIFANTGAEAVEAAVKHAELDRVMRAGALIEDIKSTMDSIGDFPVDDQAYALAGAEKAGGLPGLIAAITAKNAELQSQPPLLLTVEGSFHGKLIGSTQLTHNANFRTPFSALATPARFVPLEDPDALKRIIDEHQVFLLDLVVDDGRITVAERPLPIFTAFVLEPIQGEGGITLLSSEFAAQIQQTCAAIGCPVIVDEIQTGMGRTGSFLASTAIGLRGDYYTLGKSLGGGLAKASVTLVRKSLYRPEFEFVHSSTFAKDAFSTHIARKVLEMLEAEDGAAYRRAAERGSRISSMLEGLRTDFPDVVKEVRGRGLILGMEFHDQSGSASAPLREAAQAGVFGYVLAGYFLREHRIRVFPTASATNTLRFEPSIFITDAEIDRLESAMRTACDVLSRQDGDKLTGR